jgi:tetratricopeptide (TPR) repeat protein
VVYVVDGAMSDEARWRDQVQSPNATEAAEAQVNLAYVLDERGETKEAERLYRLALTGASPAIIGKAATNLGVLAEQGGRADEAEALYRQAQSTPSFETATINLGRLVGLRGDRVSEERLYRDVIDASGTETADALDRLGDLLDKLGRGEEAELAYQQAAASGDRRVAARAARRLLMRYHKESRMEEAMRIYRIAIEDPDLDLACASMLELGGLLMSSGRLDEASEIFQRVIELDHSTVSLIATSNLAYILMDRGELRIAEEMFKRVLASEIHELEGPAHFGLSQIYENMDRFSEAETERGLTFASGSVEVLEAADRAAKTLSEDADPESRSE